MAKTVKIKNEKLIPFYNQLAALLTWLRPGKLALKVARMKAAAESAVVSYNDQKEKLIDELVQFAPPEEGKPKKRTKKPHDIVAGIEVWDFGQNEAEFEERDKELREAETEITFSTILTLTDIEKMEKERVDKVTGPDGKVTSPAGIDFAVLMPIIEDDEPPAPKKKAAVEETAERNEE